MSEAYKKLIKTLQALFEMDKADLDFGIYRIMNQKRDEISRFLQNDLLAQVREAFADFTDSSQAELKQALQAAIEQARKFGAPDPENTDAVLEIKQKLASKVDITAVENEVFSHLHTFFSRYYDKGDFISQRRYKKDTYAIPYEGEEVKLYWANHDQYYIKSSEHLRDYAFVVKDREQEKTVRFKLLAADTEKDNVKAEAGKERRFVLDADHPLSVENGELHIHFHYKPAGKKKQTALNKEAVETLFRQEGYDEWLEPLEAPAPTEKNPKRTLLEKHLNDYTARNTFDYFIHKDLGGFLRRELDFYIKNEVLHLDDIDDTAFAVTETHLRKIKVIRTIAHKLIRMLAQLEDFQKKLWLKKKFVVETHYCMTLDRVPEDLYGEIVANAAQHEEWMKLGFTTEDTEITEDFLRDNPFLVLDTRFFDEAFRDKLLASIENLDEQCDGLLIHSENFQALNLLQEQYRQHIKTITIDPPYNRQGDGFPYKDNYPHSSWLTMVFDRFQLAHPLLQREGAIFSNIDENERDSLQAVLDQVFGRNNRIEELIWAQNTTHSQSPLYSTNHEYIKVYARNRSAAERNPYMFREPKPGYRELMDLLDELNSGFPPIKKVEQAIQALFQQHIEAYKSELAEQGLEYNTETKKQDPWRGLYNYCHTEYRDETGQLVPESEAKKHKARLVVWREDNPSAPAQKQSASTRDPNDPNYRFYRPIHPITGKPCPHPKTGWRWPFIWHDDTRDNFQALDRAGRIVWGEDEAKIPQYKRFLHDVETNVAKSFFHDYTDGEKQIAALFGETGLFPTPKPTTLPARFISQTSGTHNRILDFFAGSGTTAHAVINLNREDNGQRKYILVEMGEYFDTVLKPRIQKVVYSKDWKDGKPKPDSEGNLNGISHCFKYLRLESYEDTLNNLILKPRTQQQNDLLKSNPALREDYMLGYWLDVETADSPSLLNIDQFEDPFNYKLNIATGSAGATKPTRVDLIETFNYLIGLTVKHIDTVRGFRVVTGTNPKDESVLVVWRNLKEKDNAALEAFMEKQAYHPRDTEFDHIYVNGDHTLEDPHSKVKMIEIEFKRLMFDVRDV